MVTTRGVVAQMLTSDNGMVRPCSRPSSKRRLCGAPEP